MTKYIVIGAGWFGVCAVRAIESLSKDAEIVVLQIGSKDYIDINVANPRLAVEPDAIDTVYQPLSKAWNRARLMHIQEIDRVSSGQVVVVDSEGAVQTLEADGIVIATGSVQSSPLMKDSAGKSKEERKAEFTAFRDAVKASKAGALVVGGGTTGVELAAEIGTDFPDVKCTLLNKPELLLSGLGKRASMHKIAMKQLKKLEVEVITGDYIEDLKEDYIGTPKKFTTKKGVDIEADIVVMCAGGHPNVPFDAADALDETTKGLVVNAAMLCEKLGTDPTKPVWAVGDCTMFGGRGLFADTQIAALSASIRHFEKSGGSTEGGPMKYKHKPSESCPGMISLGRRGGAATVPFPNVWLGKTFKAKDLAVGYVYKKYFGLKV